MIIQPGSLPRRVLRAAPRCVAMAAGAYLLAVLLLGLVPRPVDILPLPVCCTAPADATGEATPPEPATTHPGAPESVTVYAISNGVHVDLVLPARLTDGTGVADVLDPAGADRGHAQRTGPADRHGQNGWFGQAEYLAIGWGAREFYLTTPDWADLKPATALRALLRAPAVLHVDMMPGPPLVDADTRVVPLTEQEYRRLVAFVGNTLARDAAGQPVPVHGPAGDGGKERKPGVAGYGPESRFYEAQGRFSPFRTCNTWAADALAAAGVRTPLWTPLAQFVLHHLPANR